MPQLAIYIEEEIQRKIDRAAKAEGVSRSAWVKGAILEKIQSGLPESWFKLWGSWEDSRSPKEILRDIRGHEVEVKREKLR